MKRGLWSKIKAVALTDVSVLFRGFDARTTDELERVLIEADFGATAFELLDELKQEVSRGRLKSPEAVRAWLAQRVAHLLGDGTEPGRLALGDGSGPGVILVVGVNGVGKTTQIAKLARRLVTQRKSVLLAGTDTYRAGATEQLVIWADRLGVPCVSGSPRGDPAAVAFDAVQAAETRHIDAVLIDTAGRLHTEQDLMGELRKIHRVVGRRRTGAPHEVLLVLDGTVGQNALAQGRAFAAALPVTGLVVTKLDGSAKGGSVVALRHELGIPIRFLGTGEGLDDLEVFDPAAFAERLLSD